MVRIPVVKSSSIQHDVQFVHYGLIQSPIDDKEGYTLECGYIVTAVDKLLFRPTPLLHLDPKKQDGVGQNASPCLISPIALQHTCLVSLPSCCGLS